MTDADPNGWDVLASAAELVARGEAFALATVVWRQEPSSSHRGSRAIVTADGRVEGWIGGACAEPVVLREARRVISSGEPRLIYLGTSPESVGDVPDGAVFVAMSCQSEGAMHIFVEPVVPAPDLLVIGDSPMTRTLVELVSVLDWRVQRVPPRDLATATADGDTAIVVATQGHGDEEAMEWAASRHPAFLGLVASHRRGEAVLGYLADHGVDRELLARVRTPVGLDLGRTSHREIAVSVLAELVQLRASGGLAGPGGDRAAQAPGQVEPSEEAVDPVCGMTVPADDAHHPYGHQGHTYHFCCVGCHERFAAEPEAYVASAARETET